MHEGNNKQEVETKERQKTCRQRSLLQVNSVASVLHN